jgi:hypothetical protein
MHRRSYIPGSHVKTSRAKLLRERSTLQSRLRELTGVHSETTRALIDTRATLDRTFMSRVRRAWRHIRALLTRRNATA